MTLENIQKEAIERFDWVKRWRDKYDIGSWIAPNGKRYTYSEIYGFIQSEIATAYQKGKKEGIENIRTKVEKLPMLNEKYAHWAKEQILGWCFPIKLSKEK